MTTATATRKPLPSQLRAIAQFKAFMESQLDKNPERKDTLVKFETTPTDYGCFWVLAETDMLGLGENNLLRFLDRQHWYVQIGRGGSITVWSSPKHFHQFKGKRAYCMNFKKI
jgi:hypothetical protein